MNRSKPEMRLWMRLKLLAMVQAACLVILRLQEQRLGVVFQQNFAEGLITFDSFHPFRAKAVVIELGCGWGLNLASGHLNHSHPNQKYQIVRLLYGR